jgi:uncharacterized protein YdeI (YjbR/CyaY-like superfamily)
MKSLTIYDKNEFRKWLKENHKEETKVAVIVHRKHTGKNSPSHRELMEEAICFGWIDTTLKRLDEERYVRHFSKRTKNSKWSNNTMKYGGDLIKQGRMMPMGLKYYKEALKKKPFDFDVPKNPGIPAGLKKALDGDKIAKENFDNFPPSIKKMIYRRILLAKREETKERRIKLVVSNARIDKRTIF